MKKIIILFGVLLVIVALGWYIFTRTASAPTVSPLTSTPLSQAVDTSGPSTALLLATVNYTVKGFSPAIITIRQGGTVTFTSVDGSPMWVASAVHPTHLIYDGTSRTEHCPNPTDTAFDQCGSGVSYTFKFLKLGEWKYHNHMNAGDWGSVTVVQ
ncbi:MAG: hypothetical protein HY228_00640 [Candidatus Yonathbacteria bacterium]|nr:hypothetical protein [Candidatus Yonathbacteria bacterium]